MGAVQLASKGRRTGPRIHRACGSWDRTTVDGLAQCQHLSPWALLVKLLLNLSLHVIMYVWGNILSRK